MNATKLQVPMTLLLALTVVGVGITHVAAVAGDEAKGDTDDVQQRGRKQEGCRVFIASDGLRHLGSMSVTVEDRKKPTNAIAANVGSSIRNATAAPRRRTDRPIPISTSGRVTSLIPTMPPTAIIDTKATGTTYIALPPRNAA